MANTVAELIFIPAPGVGHMMSTIEIAKLLVSRDQRLSVTVLVIKPPPMGSGSTITTYIESLAKKALDRISFIELPQDETQPIRHPKAPMKLFEEFINTHCKYVRNIVADMMSQPGTRWVAGFVIDMFCIGMMDVANEFNIPTYVFFTSNAAFLGFKLHIQTLCDDETIDVVELSNSEATIPVPFFVKPMPTKVFPKTIATRNGLDFVLGSARKLREAKAIIVNTFLELERYAVESLSYGNQIPPVYPVGPILNLEGNVTKPSDHDIITWLDSQLTSSVVFLCFGSVGSFDEVQVKEIAHALERSGYHFVWSLRKPPSPKQTSITPVEYEDVGLILPEGFLERTAGIGRVIGWAPQVALLGHRAVGGFVSHCGWNSLLESLWFGVPTATWPMYAEQQFNAFEMVEELGLAVEIKMDYKKDLFNPEAKTVIVTAEEIENGIRRLMEGGSSYESVGSLIQDFLRNIS